MIGEDVARVKALALDHVDELVQLNLRDRSKFYEQLYALKVPKGLGQNGSKASGE